MHVELCRYLAVTCSPVLFFSLRFLVSISPSYSNTSIVQVYFEFNTRLVSTLVPQAISPRAEYNVQK